MDSLLCTRDKMIQINAETVQLALTSKCQKAIAHLGSKKLIVGYVNKPFRCLPSSFHTRSYRNKIKMITFIMMVSLVTLFILCNNDFGNNEWLSSPSPMFIESMICIFLLSLLISGLVVALFIYCLLAKSVIITEKSFVYNNDMSTLPLENLIPSSKDVVLDLQPYIQNAIARFISDKMNDIHNKCMTPKYHQSEHILPDETIQNKLMEGVCEDLPIRFDVDLSLITSYNEDSEYSNEDDYEYVDVKMMV